MRVFDLLPPHHRLFCYEEYQFRYPFDHTIGYIGVQVQAPVYQATAKILVVDTQPTKISDLLSLSNQQLVQVYIEMLKTKPIFDAASVKLGVVIDPEKVQVMQVTTNQIVHVIVEDSDSQRAAQIANTLIEVLIEQSNKAETDQYSTYETALNSQIQDAQKQISSLNLVRNLLIGSHFNFC